MIENDQEAVEALKSITPREVAQFVAGLAVGAGTSRIVHAIIANNVPMPDKTISKVNLGVASAFIGMMAKDATRAYTGRKIDEYATTLKQFRGKLKKTEKDTESETTDPVQQ